MEGHRLITVPTGRFDGRSYILLCPRDNGAIVIDPDINIDEIIRILEEEKASTKYILLTHCHYDHMSSSDILREKTGAKTAIHRLDLPALSDPWLNMSQQFDQPLITSREIDAVLEEGSEISACGVDVKVLHTPGHTPGCCCFLVGGDLFTGDTLFRGSYGNTDFPGGDMRALIHSTARLFSLDGALAIYPGHGGPSTIAQERATNPINI
jgi:hydroxyacylglutathione hydrolase